LEWDFIWDEGPKFRFGGSFFAGRKSLKGGGGATASTKKNFLKFPKTRENKKKKGGR